LERASLLALLLTLSRIIAQSRSCVYIGGHIDGTDTPNDAEARLDRGR
jgi:hypothetical protein